MKNHLRVTFWIVLFFATGAAIGIVIGMFMIQKGAPTLFATSIGAGGGGVGAWLIFARGIRVQRWLRNQPPPAH